jgi:uncharacterized membrane protein YhhN
MLLALVLCVSIACCVAALLHADSRGDAQRARVFKAAASLGFVGLALALGALDRGIFGYFILAGLVLSLGGDVALATPGKRLFTTGLLLFLLGHAAYIVACASRAPPGDWLSRWSLLPAVSSAAALGWLWRHLGVMRIPVLAYVVTITVMVISAIAVFMRQRGQASCLVLGAILFYISDLSVARDRFVSHGFANRAWGLPAYYAGQVLMAWTLV